MSGDCDHHCGGLHEGLPSCGAQKGTRGGVPEFAERLRKKSRRVTGARKSILDILSRQSHPITIRGIHDQLPKGDCDLATIYRSMHLLEGMGMVKRYEFGDGQARFELLREGDDGHHHHLVCTGCAVVVELHECGMGELEARMVLSHGFSRVTHKLEFFGLCPRCQGG